MSDARFNPEVDGAAVLVIEGPGGQLRQIWNRMQLAAGRLHGKARYSAFGPNSNSFWGAVLDENGFPHERYEPRSNLWAPGTGINLRNPKWWTDHNRFVPPLSGDQSAVNQAYSQADVAPTDNGMSAFGASAVSRAADTDSRKSVRLRRLTALADMSDEDFAAATQGANWRRLLQG